MRATLSAMLLFFLLWAGCSDSSSGPESEDEATPIEITMSPLEADNRMAYSPQISARGGEGIERLQVSDGLGLDTLINASQTTLNLTYDLPREDLPAEVTYTITAEDSQGSRSSEEFTVTVAYTNPEPELSVTYDERVLERERQIHLTAEDLYGLASLRVEINGQAYELAAAGQPTRLEETITHTFTTEGQTTIRATAEDLDGQAAVYEGSVYVVPKRTFSTQFRGFFDKQPDRYGSLTLENLETGDVFELEANNNGEVSQETFEGPHIVSNVSGEFYDVSRMRVDRDVYPDELQYWHGENHTYIASGKEGTPWVINITTNMDPSFYVIETVDKNINPYTNQDFLENISRLLHRYQDESRFIAMPKPWMTQYVVLNTGNPDYSEDFSIWSDYINNDDIPRDPKYLPGEGRYPPGVPLDSDQIQNFREFVVDLKQIFNSDVLGLNPFDIEVVEGSADELTGFFSRGPPYDIVSSYLEDNIQYIGGNSGTSGLEGRNFVFDDYDNAMFIRSSSMIVPLTLMGLDGINNTWPSNEDNHWGTTREASPAICSVKDTGGWDSSFDTWSLPDYCTSVFSTPDGRSFKPVDVWARKVFAGFGAFSGRMPNNEYFKQTSPEQIWEDVSDGFSGVQQAHRGFNVYIQPPDE